MTYEEALERYKDFGEFCTDDECCDGDCEKCGELSELIKEALGKQIARKKHKYMGYRCVCGEEVAKNQKYCEYCGQRLLDWSDEK